MSPKPSITPLPRHKCPDGVFKAELTNARLYLKSDNTERVQFTFRLLDGPAAGKTFLRTTSLSLSEKSHRYQITKALAGSMSDLFGEKPIETIQLEELIGSKGMVLIENAKNRNGVKYSNIAQVFPVYDRGVAA